MTLPTSTIHHSSKLPTRIYQKSITFLELMFCAVLETQSLLTTSHLLETSQKNHQLPDICTLRELNNQISILMVPEEVTMKSWPEVLLPTPESLISSLIKSVHKLNTSQLDKSWISVTLPLDIKPKTFQPSY